MVLMNGCYEAISPNSSGQLWNESLGLYLGVHAEKLRYFSVLGHLVLTPEETAIQAQSERQQAQAVAQQARAEAAHLAAQLRALGIESGGQ